MSLELVGPFGPGVVWLSAVRTDGAFEKLGVRNEELGVVVRRIRIKAARVFYSADSYPLTAYRSFSRFAAGVVWLAGVRTGGSF